MTEKKSPAYDIGFSFLTAKLDLALRFSEALKPLSSFVFSEQQERLAGTSALESFRTTFLEDSRLNVILYSAGWGESGITAIEETAIQDRIKKDGWNSLLIVKCDKAARRKWMPDTNLYFDFDTYPFEQVVGAIKAQAGRAGAIVRALTPIERALAIAEAAEDDRKTKRFLESDDGVRAAEAAVEELFAEVKGAIAALRTSIPRWEPVFGQHRNRRAVARMGHCSVGIAWERKYGNSLAQAVLTATVVRGHFTTPEESAAGRLYGFGEPRDRIALLAFVPHRHPGSGFCWLVEKGDTWFSTREVAGRILEELTTAARSADAR
jgi:hypothetical protein